MYYIKAQLDFEEELKVEKGLGKHDNFFTRFYEIFTIPRIRRATQASGIVMIAQQMCKYPRKLIFDKGGSILTNLPVRGLV